MITFKDGIVLNSTTQEAEAGRSQIAGQLGQKSEILGSLQYIPKPSLKIKECDSGSVMFVVSLYFMHIF